MSPPLQATLLAAGFELALHIAGYEFPHFDTGWDANALCCYIELDLQRYGSFHASHQPVIYTAELEHFAQQLRVECSSDTAPAKRRSSTEPRRSA